MTLLVTDREWGEAQAHAGPAESGRSPESHGASPRDGAGDADAGVSE